ncbi:MAG: low molecular weight protein arginine phosphatase [Gemmatimonadales bacterium]
MSLPVRSVLGVCSGNTCRSPLAAVILAARLAEAPALRDVLVSSAGTGARSGEPASEGSYLVALERGLDLSAHRSRMLTRELVAGADLILTMGASHLRQVTDLGGADRAHLLTEWAGESAEDVDDPYGQAVEVYRETAEQLDQLMAQVVARLQRERDA